MRLLGWFLGLLVVTIGLIWVAGMMSPREITVQRTAEMAAPPETIFLCVTDLEIWQEWEPWGKADESLKIRYGDKRRGVGASYSWSADKMGQGELTIIALEPTKRVDYTLVFNGDEAAPASSSFTLERLDNGHTRVIWTFESDMGENPISRLLGSVLKGAVSTMYEAGLVELERSALSRLAVGDPAAAVGGE
jgi:uncharacterized protein YndB with AHSA1/START domain